MLMERLPAYPLILKKCPEEVFFSLVTRKSTIDNGENIFL